MKSGSEPPGCWGLVVLECGKWGMVAGWMRIDFHVWQLLSAELMLPAWRKQQPDPSLD